MARMPGFVLAAVLAILATASPGQVPAPGVPPETYRRWLEEEVAYLITPVEKDVFLQLDTDRSRDLFIEAFWKQRDPVPETTRNEFREEHYRRLRYANQTYGRGSPLPGWKTDRGKVHIILGPPKNIETFDDVNNVYPTEIWFYQDMGVPGLPTGFNIIFFKRNGMGDYVLYSPSADGPRSLMASTMGDSRDDQAYRELRELAPNLASQVLSLIPGGLRSAGALALSSDMLLANVFESPREKVKDAYAEALLRYRDSIDVDYTANYIETDATLYVSRDDDGRTLVHYGIEPARLVLFAEGGRNESLVELDGRVSDELGRTVYQFNKAFPLDFSDDVVGEIRRTSIEFQDVFPCVPGRFRFDLLFKNTVSKEFGSFEAALEIPEDSAQPALGALFLGYAAEPAADGAGSAVPFRIGGRQLLGDARRTFIRSESLIAAFQAFGLPVEWKIGGKIRYLFRQGETTVLDLSRPLTESGAGGAFFLEQSLAGFAPGYYDLDVSLLDPAGVERGHRTAAFAVSGASSLQRPRIVSKVLTRGFPEEWDYIQGVQSLNIGRTQEAERLLGSAFEKNPRDERFALAFGQALFLAGRYGNAEEVLRPLSEGESPSFEVLAMLGRVSQALGKYRDAIGFYDGYLRRAGMNIEILNYVGTCHFQLGEKDQALSIWRQSLKINPRQDRLQALVDSLEKK